MFVSLFMLEIRNIKFNKLNIKSKILEESLFHLWANEEKKQTKSLWIIKLICI